jgi:hypothetical protein
MGDAGFPEELGDWKCPGARLVIGSSATFQFGTPFGHRRIGPTERPGNFFQLPGKGKWPGFPAFDPLQCGCCCVNAPGEGLRSSRSAGRRSNQRADRSDTAKLPERRRSSSLGTRSLALTGHRRGLAFAIQQIGVEDFRAQRVNQERAAPAALPENLYTRLSPSRPVESALTDARRSQGSEKLRLGDRQRSAPVDDDRRWGLLSLHDTNRNIKRRLINRILAIYVR